MSWRGNIVNRLMTDYKVNVLRVSNDRIGPIIISLQLILRHKPQILRFYGSNGLAADAFMCEAR